MVKLGAEVCDLSEDMRTVLEKGTAMIVQRILAGVQRGQADRSIASDVDAPLLAESLYQLWLGASLLVLAPALLGMLLGQWLRQRISAALFKRCFFIGLGLLGAHLLLNG